MEIYRVLLVTLIASSGLVTAGKLKSALCGGLGEGSNPCSDAKPSGILGVKAVETPKAKIYASETAINEAAAARAEAARAEAARSVSRGSTVVNSFGQGYIGGGCGAPAGIGSSGSSNAGKGEQGPSANDLLALDPSTAVAPSFAPIGDLCHLNTPESRSSSTREIVIPARPAKPRCGSCIGLGCPGSSATSSNSISSGPDSAYSSASSSVSGSSAVRRLFHGQRLDSGLSGSWTQRPLIEDNRHFRDFSGSVSNSGVTSGMFGGYSELSPPPSIDELDGRCEGKHMTFEEQEKLLRGESAIPAVAADPVSVTLAYKRIRGSSMGSVQKKQSIPEGSLFFGHQQDPIDGRVISKVKRSDVPEEKLYTFDKPVIELQTISCGRSVDENEQDSWSHYRPEEIRAMVEANERERRIQRQTESRRSSDDAYISYGDLGFARVSPSSNRFVDVPITTTLYNDTPEEILENSDYESACGPLGPPLPDYQPGGVIIEDENYPAGLENGTEENEDNRSEEEVVPTSRSLTSARRRPKLLRETKRRPITYRRISLKRR